jgi:hypothetical protein
MSTNTGLKRLSMIGNIPGFGMEYFDPTGMAANIFGFSHLQGPEFGAPLIQYLY